MKTLIFIVFSVFLFLPSISYAQTAWNSSDWTLYDTIIIGATNVDEELVDFPVYVDLSDLSPQFWSTTPTSSTLVGTDIRVTTAANTELPRELVSASSTAQTGELHFKADSISSTADTVFRIYYNGTTSGDYATSSTYGAQSVWSDYELVLHLNENTATATDSTANNRNFIYEGDTPSLSTTLPLGGHNFDGTGDYLSYNGLLFGGDQDPLTYQMWLNADSLAGNFNNQTALIGEFDGTSNDTRNYWYLNDTNDTSVYDQFLPSGGSSQSSSSLVTLDSSLLLHLTKSADTVRNYRDGVLFGSPIAHSETYSGSILTKTWIGHRDDISNNSYELDGDMDEIRVRDTELSAAWIKAEYANQSDASSFYGVNSVSITGTLYENDGVTPVGAGKTIVAAVGTSTPSLHTATTTASSTYAIRDIQMSTIGAWATTSAAGNNDSWRGITYGNGLFVAVGRTGNRVMTSPDGITWTTRSAAGNDDRWLDVTYGNGLFVAVGDSGDRVMTSPDGITWTARSAAGDNDNWYSITYGNGLFVASAPCRLVGTSDCLMTSPDGITWTARSAAGDNDNWYGVAYSQEIGIFVAVGDNGGDRVMTSPDGITWTARSAVGNDDHWNNVVYGNNQFVAVGYEEGGGGDDVVMTSPDGINWTARSAAGDDDAWYGLVYANGQYVATGYTYDGSNDRVMTSPDGINWSTVSVAGDNDNWFGLAYGSGRFVSVSSQGFSSADDSVMYTDAGFGSDTPITLFVDENATTSSSTATTLTFGLNADADTITITADLIADTVLLQKTSTDSSSNEIYFDDTHFYDSYDAGDTDVLFTATTSTTTVDADLRIASGTVAYAPQHLVIDGDFDNYGTFYAERGEVIADATIFDIRRPIEKSAYDIGSENVRALHFDSTGTILFIGQEDDVVAAYDLPAPYDTRSMTLRNSTSTLQYESTRPESIDFSPDGTRLYFTGEAGEGLHEYALATAWDVSTASFVQSVSSTTLGVANTAGLAFSTDGTKLFIADVNGGDRLREYDLSTAWDISSASFVDEITLPTTTTREFAFSPDGRYMLYLGQSEEMQVYTFSTPWDLSTNSVFISELDLDDLHGGENGYGKAYALAVDPAGTSMFVGYGSPEVVVRFDLDDLQDFTGNFSATSSLHDLTNQSDLGVTMPYFLDVEGDFTNNGISTGLEGADISLSGINVMGEWDTSHTVADFILETGSVTVFDTDLTTGDITISAGAAAAAADTMNIRGDLTQNGIFNASTSNFTFSGASSTLSGTLTGTSSLGDITLAPGGDGSEWVAVSAAGDNDDWYEITYGNDSFVAVGYGGDDRAMTSPDGITWTARSAAGDDDGWNYVTYANGLFVAVGLSGDDRVMTSPDGITWTARSAAGDDDGWASVTYANGLFVAVGLSGDDRVMTSPDGITWTARSAAEDNDQWISVAYGNGLFVAVGYGGNDRVMTSPDGITWTARSVAGNNDDWSEVVFADGLFVAIGETNGSQDVVMTSPDGITWTVHDDPGVNDDWTGITYGNGRFVAVSDNDGSGSHVMVSATSSLLFVDNASTSDFTISKGTTTAPAQLTVDGDLAQNGLWTAASTTYFTGATPQTATGSITGTSQFNDLSVTNTSGNGSTTFSLSFGADAAATGTVTFAASTSIEFNAGSTYTFNNVDWNGSSTEPIYLRSSEEGTEWFLEVYGSQLNVDYIDVSDSNAASTSGGMLPTNSIDSGNNTNWNFGGDWNPTDWTLYDTITIDHNNIDESLGDFPVYVDLSDLSPTFWTTVSDGGGDIRVTTDAGTPVELAREVVSASTTLETGELHFKADFINQDADTSFRIYYNGTNSDYNGNQQYGAESVWSDYAAVWHMDEGANDQADSTANNNVAIRNSGGVASTSSRLGGGLEFDGIGRYDLTTTVTNNNNRGLSFWYYKESNGGGDFGSLFGETSQFANGLRHLGSNELILRDDGSQIVSSGELSNNNWHYVSYEWDGTNWTSNTNGVQIETAGGSWFDEDPARLIGINTNTNRAPDGVFDEMRVGPARSESWRKAEYYNQSTTTNFYRLSSGNGSSTISNHDLGQVDDAFNFQNKTDEPLFAFKLTPESGNATVTSVTIDLSGAREVSKDDFSNIRLYVDENSDAAFDGGDTLVDDLGVMTANGQLGTIAFENDFLLTTARNFIVIMDFNAPARGAQLNFDLYPSGVRMLDADGGVAVTGSVDRIQHNRAESRGGGGAASAIGDPAPAGDGDVSGGTNDGGELIGNETDFYWPSAESGDWTDAPNAYDQIDGTYATADSPLTNDFSAFNDSVPGGDVVEGIEVKMEVSANIGGGDIGVELSWDGGTSWTSSKSTPTLTTTDTVIILGGVSDTWGRSWTPGELSDANFSLRVTGNPSGNTVQIDAIQVKVYHQASGGGGGGGGAI